MNDHSQTSPANSIRILVVDDHTLFRRGLTALLARDPQLRVVGDAADAGQAQRKAQELQPDIILLDNHLPGVNGVDALPALQGAAPAARILMLTVSEDEIATAILTLIEKQKLIAEGAGATPVAAALFNKLPIKGKKTVCVVSGGNIDVNILSRVITRGQVTSGRRVNLVIMLEDRPGQLLKVSEIISQCGANVVGVHHNRSDANMAITGCFLKLELETRDAAQIKEIEDKLTAAGFKLVSDQTAAQH